MKIIIIIIKKKSGAVVHGSWREGSFHPHTHTHTQCAEILINVLMTVGPVVS